MKIAEDPGPPHPTTGKHHAGFTSVDALHYQSVAAGFEEVALPCDRVQIATGRISAQDRLRYKVFPCLDAPLGYQSTFVALDIQFTDGSRLSELEPYDQYQMSATAAGQGESKILYCDQWNDVQIDLGAAAGRSVASVMVVIDPPDSEAGKEILGWIDDVEIGPRPADPPLDDYVAWVDTRRGTNASSDFSRGNNLPLTAWPNGFNFLTPVTNARTNRWPYEYHRANDDCNRPRLQGIAFSHQPSPWMGDRNQLIIMPVAGPDPISDPLARAAAFHHDEEVARPDFYAVELANGITVQVAPTDHGAIFEYDFGPSGVGQHLVIDTIDQSGSFTCHGSAISGWVENGSEFGRTRMFCYGEFSEPAIAQTSGSGAAQVLSFAARRLTLRIATSMISVEQARHSLELELAGNDFAEVREAAHAAWQERLGVITLDTATPPQRRTLYGCLYRLNLYPNSTFENVGTATEPNYRYASPVLPAKPSTDSHTGAVVRDGKMYVNNGFWDTYRTAWPAYALVDPPLAAELIDGFVQQYRDGGWIARWSSPGYADLMTGTSSDVAFADAYLKGVPLPDPLATYDAGLRNATVCPDNPAVGRKGLQRGLFSGYVSTEVAESVSWALEGYLNDFGLAMMAAQLGCDPETPPERVESLRDEAEYFRRRSLNYVLLFDDAINFFQGRDPDGSFAKSASEFDPCEWGGDFTETDGWNFAFHVAHDPGGLANLYCGADGLRAKLDEYFSTPEKADKKGTYGSVIHEMTEARAVRMGQFGFSNQPAHHIAYLYNYAGAPHRSQEIVREVLQRLFVGEQIGQGYPGDEDNGEMSAWYLLSALGLYPLRMGAPEYAIGSPLFDRAEVRVRGGQTLVVRAENQSPRHPYVQSVSFQGKEIVTPSIPATDLASGGELVFVMGAEPSDWGVAAPPPSLTTAAGHAERAAPLLDCCVSPVVAEAAHEALFDDDAGTEATISAAGDVCWSLAHPVTPSSYTLTSGASPADPAAWRLEGSVNGEDWQVLDEREQQRFRWRRQTRVFRIAEPTAAQHFRLTVQAAPSSKVVLSEIELLR